MNNLIVIKKIIGWFLFIGIFIGILAKHIYEIKEDIGWLEAILCMLLSFVIVGLMCFGCYWATL